MVKESNIVDFQAALDWAIKWAEEKGCAFHLEGDKRPVYLAYLKLHQTLPTCFDDVKLGTATLERTDEATVLGLYRRVRPIYTDSSKINDVSI